MSKLINLPVSSIIANPHQPRKEFDEKAMEGLQLSIERKGIIHPVIVQPTNQKDVYILVDGERRWRAAQAVGLAEIPAIVQEQTNDILERALISNIQREKLAAVEEKGAYEEMLSRGYNEEGIADTLGVQLRRVKARLGYSESPDKKKSRNFYVSAETAGDIRFAVEAALEHVKGKEEKSRLEGVLLWLDKSESKFIEEPELEVLG